MSNMGLVLMRYVTRMMSGVELRHYRYFVAVAEESSFTRAAARLRMAQPPLSQQIGQVEHELGVRLFIRHPRGVELTSAGRLLLAESYVLLQQDARARELTRRASGPGHGPLRVASMPSIFTGLLPGAVRRIRSALPDLDLQVLELDAPDQLLALRQPSVDVGLGRVVHPPRGFEATSVGSEPVVVALPADHRLAETAAPVDLAALAGETFVMFPRQLSSETYDAIIAACHAVGFSPRGEEEAVGDHRILGMVACQRGVALLPMSTTRVRVAGVSYRGLIDDPATVALTALWRMRAEPPFLAELCAAIAAELDQLVAELQAPAGNRSEER